MTTYLLVDTANTFFRARHVAHRGMDQWTRLGLAMHVTMSAVNKAWRIAGADHVVDGNDDATPVSISYREPSVSAKKRLRPKSLSRPGLILLGHLSVPLFGSILDPCF